MGRGKDDGCSHAASWRSGQAGLRRRTGLAVSHEIGGIGYDAGAGQWREGSGRDLDGAASYHREAPHPAGGAYRGRFSDLLNREYTPFLSLTDVTVSSLEAEGVLWRGEFLALNKGSIVLVKALDD